MTGLETRGVRPGPGTRGPVAALIYRLVVPAGWGPHLSNSSQLIGRIDL